jgi:uncharacterized protein YecE (DUF72 family)
MSGWVYPPWRGVFYPPRLGQKNELAYASTHLTSIEVNSSFYAPPKPSSWTTWRDTAPDDFVFSVKGAQFITHIHRLRNARLPLADFFSSGLLALGAKLGAVLWQLPPTARFDATVLDEFLALLPRTTQAAAALAAEHTPRMDGLTWFAPEVDLPIRHALEVRNASFEHPDYLPLLQDHGVAAVLGDTAGRWPRFEQQTAEFSYLRLHGDSELHPSGYDDTALDAWAERIRPWRDDGRDVYVYFDNEVKVRAPIDAMGLIARLR